LGRCGTMGERSVTIVQQHLKLGKQLNGIDFLFVLNFWHVRLMNIDYKTNQIWQSCKSNNKNFLNPSIRWLQLILYGKNIIFLIWWI